MSTQSNQQSGIVKPIAQRPQPQQQQQQPPQQYNYAQYGTASQQQPLQYQPSIYQQQYDAQYTNPYMYNQYQQQPPPQQYYQPPPPQYAQTNQQQRYPAPQQPQQQQPAKVPPPQPRANVAAPVPHNTSYAAHVTPQSTAQTKPISAQQSQQPAVKQQSVSKPTAPQQAPQPAAPVQPPQQPAPVQPQAPPQQTEQPQSESMTAPYLGCRISLISNANVRYEGILHAINPNEATVILSTVRCYGTENRTTASHYVPQTNDIYSEITFAGKDIQELSVLDTAVPAATPQQPIADPAIQSVGTVIKQTDNDNNSVTSENKEDTKPKQRTQYAKGPTDNNKSTGFNRNRTNANTTNKIRYINDTIEPIDSNFDFQASNARFDKAELANELKQQLNVHDNTTQDNNGAPDDVDTNAVTDSMAAVNLSASLPIAADKLPPGSEKIEVKYDKSKSFFDSISRDNTTQQRNKDRSNVDTFGNVARGFRGGHRGGRGRGGNRGGHGDRENGGGYNSNRGRNTNREWRTNDS